MNHTQFHNALRVQTGAEIWARAKPEKTSNDASGAVRGDISWPTILQRVGLKKRETALEGQLCLRIEIPELARYHFQDRAINIFSIKVVSCAEFVNGTRGRVGSGRRFYHDVIYGGRMMLTLDADKTRIDRGRQSNEQSKEVDNDKEGH